MKKKVKQMGNNNNTIQILRQKIHIRRNQRWMYSKVILKKGVYISRNLVKVLKDGFNKGEAKKGIR